MTKKPSRKRYIEPIEIQKARLQNINTFFNDFMKQHNIPDIEELAIDAGIPSQNLYKWLNGESYAPQPPTVRKLLTYIKKFDQSDISSRRVLSFVYGIDLIGKVSDVTDEEWVLLKNWREMNEAQRQIMNAMQMVMLAQNFSKDAK